MAIGDFPEGATATHKDGRKIVFRDGEWRLLSGPQGGGKEQAARDNAQTAADALATQLSRVQQLYTSDLKGLAVADTGLTPAAGRFDSAAAGLSDQALAAFRVPGSGAQSDRELASFVAANQPQATDYDERIEEKLRNIRTRLDARRKALGLPEWDYEKAEPKGGDSASTGAGAPDGSDAPPSSGSPTPRPRGEVEFNDTLPDQRADAITLTPDQQSAFVTLVKSGASKGAVQALLTGFGVQPRSDAELEQILTIYRDPKNKDRPLAIVNDNTVKPVDPGDGGLGAGARGAGDTLTFGFLDELTAASDTLTKGGEYSDNLNRQRGFRAYDEENSPGARITGQLVGGLPLGELRFADAAGAARAAGGLAFREARAGGMALNEARAVGRTAADRVFTARTALEAAGLGAAYGFGSTDGDVAERLGGAALGGVVGGGGGAALTAGGTRWARAMAGRAPRVATPQQEALAAAERQDIVPFPADVGGAGTRRLTSAVSQTMAGAGPIRAGAEATQESAEAVRNRVAAAIGTPLNNAEAIGETARAGAQAFMARTGQRIGRIYDAATAAGGRARVDTPEARRVLDQELAPLAESPVQGPGVAILQGLRDALDNPITVRGLREARTQIREQFENAGLRGSNLERVAGRVIDAATDDLVNGLRAQGLDRAATQYRVADRMWRERLATIDEHLEPILGDATGAGAKSGEQIVQNLKAAMAGNNRRFSGFIQALPPNEQGIVRASLTQRLGMATKGQQDQGGEVFSLATFLTNWNEIGNRAKNVLFGAEGRAALNDLATYAAQAKQSAAYANHSNTSGALSNLSAIWNFSTLGVALAAENAGGRLLASPTFARWLARAPRVRTPAQARAHVDRLTRIARAEPAVANDVLALQQRLVDTFGSAPTRLAADEGDDHRAAVDGQRSEQARPRQELQP
jgi:hypothetical protein